MQSYYPPSGYFTRTRTSSASKSPPSAPRNLHETPVKVNAAAPSGGGDAGHLTASFSGNIVESPQSQTSSNGSVLPNTLHPTQGAGASGDKAPHTPSAVAGRSAISPSSPHPRAYVPTDDKAALQQTPETVASERDFPTVSQNSRAPLIARDYGYDDAGDDGRDISPRTALRAQLSPGVEGRYGQSYAEDADDAEMADNHSGHEPQYSPPSTLASTLPLPRPTLITSRSDFPSGPTRSQAPRISSPGAEAGPRATGNEHLPLPREGPQDAYVSQHISPLAPLPSQSSTLPPGADPAGGRKGAGKGGLESPPPATPTFTRSNTAPGLPQPSAAQPLSPAGETLPEGSEHGPGLGGVHGTSPKGAGKGDELMPIFNIFDAHLDGPSAAIVDQLKGHLDAVARLQDEVCAMHLDLEGLAPLDAIAVRVDSTPGSPPIGTGGQGSSSSPSSERRESTPGASLFASKSHQPSTATSEAKATDAKAAASKGKDNKPAAPGGATANEEASEIVQRREAGVEAIMKHLGDLSDQIRAYHHLGTPRLAFQHAGTASQPTSAHPYSLAVTGTESGSALPSRAGSGSALHASQAPAAGRSLDVPPLNRAPHSISASSPSYDFASAGASPISPRSAGVDSGSVSGSGNGAQGQSRADMAANMLRPSPVIIPPVSTTPDAAAELVDSSPVNEYATRRLAALHSHDRPLPNHPHPHSQPPFSPTDRHKPKHPSHLDQVFTARRESSAGSVPLADGRGAEAGADAGRAQDGGDISPKSPSRTASTVADRFFSGFGTGWGGGGGAAAAAPVSVKRPDGDEQQRAATGDGSRKGEQSWIETR